MPDRAASWDIVAEDKEFAFLPAGAPSRIAEDVYAKAFPDDRVASLMVQAFGALNKPDKAAEAQEVITQARPTAATFTQLAVFAYQAGQTRKGDLARQKALDLADPADRQTLKSEIDQAKQQALTQQLQNATPSPTATATPKAGGKKDKKSSGKG